MSIFDVNLQFLEFFIISGISGILAIFPGIK
jgi:hypothetical protein